jgi:antitoxin (DNA-binding transcriptional repressor) of toxin-antitoxin stability system
MAEQLTPSGLRANLYRILDRVLETGVPVEIRRKGRCLRIVPKEGKRLELLKPHPGFIPGDPEALVHMDWSDQWRP